MPQPSRNTCSAGNFRYQNLGVSTHSLQQTLPLTAEEETIFVDEIVDKVLPLNPFGLDLAIKAATTMTGNHETYIKTLEVFR